VRRANTDLNVEIVGINVKSDVAYNGSYTVGIALPWLQDTAEQNVWTFWNARWRDVRIVDSQNRLLAIYNVDDHDLSIPDNFQTLKQLLLSFAKITDSDGDGLPDDWETQCFGNLAAGPDQDTDGDRVRNDLEYVFGTDPKKPAGFSGLTATKPRPSSRDSVSFSFRRRAGSILNYVIETSSDLREWTPAPLDLWTIQAPVNLFDGTGTSEVVCTPTAAATTASPRFLRVRATPRSN
jgi:hypothetical protein